MSRTAWGTRVLWATGIVTAAAIAAGVWVIDSPSQQRLKRLDDARVSHLRTLETAASNYWRENDALPDPADPDWPLMRLIGGIRWAISALVISFPVFVFAAHRVSRDVDKHPIKRLSPVRRWLTYLTLFVAATVLIGDLTALVFNLLSGDLSLRFVLKVLVVGVIAGTVFGYYLWDLRQEEVES